MNTTARFGHDFARLQVHVDRRPANAWTRRMAAETARTPTGSGLQVRRQAAATGAPTPRCPFPTDFANEHDAGVNMMCVSDASKQQPPVCALTPDHLSLLNDAKKGASELVGRARRRMSWVGGPEFAQRVAARVFTDAAPSAVSIKATLDRMEAILAGPTLQFAGATCADPECESEGAHAAAYEAGIGKPVTLCPRAFLPGYRPELARTVIHEVVHLAGIDIDPTVKERYCMQTGNCDAPCQSTKVADAWTLFIDCIGRPLAAGSPARPAPSAGARTSP